MPPAIDLEIALIHGRARRRLPEPPMRRFLRERAGLSQLELADVVGVTPPAVSRWETGSRTPRGAVLVSYVAVLDRLAAER